ncbi:serine/threonine-protein kinase [Leptolyngbya sp. NIES-2104]|uniref:serine/threonine-protein kinase n=1 Tax=Leptolyngbya sp. NIES-2104 TaxID=1552121 RepID=UPI001CEC7A26|nr:serine/threonine-protein kinase [Leptolyngbya sp. NIES-2104]
MSTLIGSEIKRSNYRILGLVGRGQFGRVYCALDRQTGEFVALKALDRAALPTNQFLRELRFLVTLQHPNIVMCQAIEHLHGKRFLVMDYCEGGTLRQLMENHQRLHLALSVRLVCDVLAGLEHAHSQGVVHCDIKPENILLSLSAQGWTARISDFGISRLSQDISPEPANLTGSPAYMAPERFYGQYSHSTDLYAVGILLFELLVGYRPFSGLPAELRAAHLNQPVTVPTHIPTPIQDVILKALEKLKARRFHSAAQMREALLLAVHDRSEFLPEPLAIAPKVHASIVLREERSLYPVEQIGIMDTTPAPEYDRYLRRSMSVFLGHSQNVTERSYPMGFFDRRDGKASPLMTLSEPIQEFVVRSQTCFALTTRSIYKLSELAPQLLTRFHQPARIAIAPNGCWMAVATLGSRNAATLLSFWRLPQPKLVQHPTLCESTLGELIAIVAMSSRHVALISKVDRATRIDLFNRRGQVLGTLNLPVQLKQVFSTPKPFCLVGIDQARSILLIHLKPYRLIQIAIALSPKFVTAFSWGVVVCNENQLIALDYEGQQIGRSDIPLHPCAIAGYGEDGLAIATWHQGQGRLYTLSLESIRAANL